MSAPKRYDLVAHNRGMESWSEMEEATDGDYVTFEDYTALLRQRDEIADILRGIFSDREDDPMASDGHVCGEISYRELRAARAVLARVEKGI